MTVDRSFMAVPDDHVYVIIGDKRTEFLRQDLDTIINLLQSAKSAPAGDVLVFTATGPSDDPTVYFPVESMNTQDQNGAIAGVFWNKVLKARQDRQDWEKASAIVQNSGEVVTPEPGQPLYFDPVTGRQLSQSEVDEIDRRLATENVAEEVPDSEALPSTKFGD